MEANLFEIPFQWPGIMAILFSSKIIFLPILWLNYKDTEAWHSQLKFFKLTV